MSKITMKSSDAKWMAIFFGKVKFVKWTDCVKADVVYSQLVEAEKSYDQLVAPIDAEKAECNTMIAKLTAQGDHGNDKQKKDRENGIKALHERVAQLATILQEAADTLTTFHMDRDSIQFYIDSVEYALDKQISFDKELGLVGLGPLHARSAARIYQALQVALMGKDEKADADYTLPETNAEDVGHVPA